MTNGSKKTTTNAEAQKLWDNFKTGRGGFQTLVRQTMAGAMKLALELQADKANLKSFLVLAKQNQPKGENIDSLSWIVRKVMIFATGAGSESAKKLALKRARGAEYVHVDLAIPIKKMPQKIKEMGGIEKIVKLAAKKDPRRAAASLGRSSQNKRGSVVAKKSAAQDPDHAPDAAPLAGHNDHLVTVWVPMLMKLSDRDALDEMPAKAKVKIVARCINEADAKLKVRRIQVLTAKAPKSDEFADWE
jgi:hypothetical protein